MGVNRRMRVVFRTEGGSSVGMGHLSRCLSLSHVFSKEADIVFVVNEEASSVVRNSGYDVCLSEAFDVSDVAKITSLKPDLIVVDSYRADSDYIDSLRKIAKVAIFDDNGEHNPVTAHYVINGNLHATHIDYQSLYTDTLFFLGPRFLVMKPEYWHIEEEDNYKGEGILITVGGADPHHLILKFMEALRDLPIVKKVIVGPFVPPDELQKIEGNSKGFDIIWKPPSLKEHIKRSKLVLTATGSTVYEAILLGKRLVVFSLAENQVPIAEALARHGVLYLGHFENIDWQSLSEIIEREYSESDALSLDAKTIGLDGKGVFRLTEELIGSWYQ